MKRCVVLLGIMLSLALIVPNVVRGCSHDLWALIICGNPYYGTSEVEDAMYLDPQYMRDVLVKHYWFSEVRLIEYLSYPDKGKNWLRGEIRNWLGSRSDSDDLIFIFFMSHGGGYNMEKERLAGGRVDGSEGDPVDELDGVDECLKLKERLGGTDTFVEFYWDDEFREDLATLSYARLVVLLQGCKVENETEGCYTGGFVRDLSAPNRIIMTPCSEYTESYGYELYPGKPWSHVGRFSRAFIDALNPEKNFADADITKDGKVSIREAFEYAWMHDPAFWNGKETPQLDDDGDGISSYPEQNAPYGDNTLALETYFGEGKYFTPRLDLNDDGYVDMKDIALAAAAYGTVPGLLNYNARAAVVVDDPFFGYEGEMVTMRDIAAVARAFGTDYRGELAC